MFENNILFQFADKKMRLFDLELKKDVSMVCYGEDELRFYKDNGEDSEPTLIYTVNRFDYSHNMSCILLKVCEKRCNWW